MELHPDCAPLAFLLGTWKGRGDGEYPTIDSFPYNEEVVFGHVGKPFLTYGQKTRHAETGEPLHAEAGYLRSLGNGRIELALVQPTGIIETHSGSVADGHITLALDAVSFTTGASDAAKSITEVERVLEIDGDDMRYRIAMAAVGEPLTHHLAAHLQRQSS